MKFFMSEFIYHFTFLFVSVFVFIKTIFYGIYEIQNEHNKSGGIVVIVFSFLVIIFSNVMMFLN